ncbi:MAG: PQQ-binding-like beta-propeller repeat protein [Candidatus Methanofastidiosia archaeon]|jgi:outer membrane protein assembly factor BamB
MRYLFFFVLILSISSVNTIDDWPMFQHDLQHTGSVTCAAPDTAYLMWVSNVESPIATSPVISEGNIYLAALGKMTALEADSGNLIWMQEVPVVGSTPAVSENALVVGTASGFVAMNSKTGEIIWEQIIWESYLNDDINPYFEFFTSSPLIVEERVYVGAGTNKMPLYPGPGVERLPLRNAICMDIKTGEILWKVNLYSEVSSSPAYHDNILYVGAESCYALDPDDGSIKWEYNHGYYWSSSPVIIDDSVVVAVHDEYNRRRILRIQRGSVLWSRGFKDMVGTAPAVSQGKIVVNTIEDDISALDLESGSTIWTTALGGDTLENDCSIDIVPSSPVIADKKVYIGTANGLFSCLDLETGEIIWQYQTEGAIVAPAAIVDEKVYIGSTDGKLYCFGIDPDTYYEKAEKYQEQGNTKRAQEFYMRARNYYQSKGNVEMVKKCEEKIDKGVLHEIEWYWWIVIVVVCLGVFLFYLKNFKG